MAKDEKGRLELKTKHLEAEKMIGASVVHVGLR